MIRRLPILAACLSAFAFAPARAAEGLEPLPPQPRTAPAVPEPIDTGALPPDEQMQRRIAALLRDRDRRIADLVRTAQAGRPVADGKEDPALARPRSDRDRAWRDLRAALEEFLTRTPSRQVDVLDKNREAAQARQEPELSAANQMAIVECHQALAASPEGTAADAEEGWKALNRLRPELVPDYLQPRLAYLRAWFLAERARRSEDPRAKAQLTGEARAAVAAFQARFAESELALSVGSLLTGLPEPAKKP